MKKKKFNASLTGVGIKGKKPKGIYSGISDFREMSKTPARKGAQK